MVERRVWLLALLVNDRQSCVAGTGLFVSRVYRTIGASSVFRSVTAVGWGQRPTSTAMSTCSDLPCTAEPRLKNTCGRLPDGVKHRGCPCVWIVACGMYLPDTRTSQINWVCSIPSRPAGAISFGKTSPKQGALRIEARRTWLVRQL